MNTISPKTSAPRPAPRLPDELVASPTFLIKRLGFAAKERAMAAYEETGLHPYHHAILIVLDEGSHANQGSIADALGYDRGQLVGLLDELEERELARQLEDEFLAPLNEDERTHLHALLLRLAEKHEPRCAILSADSSKP